LLAPLKLKQLLYTVTDEIGAIASVTRMRYASMVTVRLSAPNGSVSTAPRV
jgi:hypothetical protein